MAYIKGVSRYQQVLFPGSVDEYIDEDSIVRAVGAFVEHLPVEEMGFLRGDETQTKGRPGYDPRTMLAIFIWGHLNNVRSSRRLERECGRNLELMWLSGKLKPDFKTLCRFRQYNGDGIKEVLARFRMWMDEVGLIGKKEVAIDGSKFKAVNSKDRNITTGQLKKRIAKEKKKIARYLKELEEADEQDSGEETGPTVEELKEKIETIGGFLEKQEEKLERMKEEGVTQESETDPDSKLMKAHSGMMMAYNVQTVVDDKHKLIIGTTVTNEGSDQGLLPEMALRTKEDLGVEELTVIADGGYYASEDIKTCEEEGIKTYVPIPETERDEEKSGRFNRSRFRYDKEKDVYVCPQSEELKKIGTTTHHQKKSGKKKKMFVYGTKACAGCPLKSRCTTSKYGRRLKRWVHEEVTERLRERLAAEPEMLKKRKGMVEHPFGTIKVGMGHERLLMKGKAKVGTELNLSVLGYNLKRVKSILGIDKMIELLKTVKPACQTA